MIIVRGKNKAKPTTKLKVVAAVSKAAIESRPDVLELITTRWLLLSGTYTEANSVVGYMRGVLSVEQSLKNAGNIRDIKFLISVSRGIIHHRFTK